MIVYKKGMFVLTLDARTPFSRRVQGCKLFATVTLVISGRTLLNFEVLTRLSWIHIVREMPATDNLQRPHVLSSYIYTLLWWDLAYYFTFWSWTHDWLSDACICMCSSLWDRVPRIRLPIGQEYRRQGLRDRYGLLPVRH